MLNSEFMRVINEKHIMTKQKIVSVLVIIFIFVLSINSLSQDTSTVNPNFAKANEAFKDRDYDLAVQLYKNLLDGELDVSMEAKILNNLGLTYKAQKRFDDATETFQRILSGKANDLEPDGHIMEAYRNYRPKAQWEIGNCFLLSGNYKKALNAYQITKSKHPFRSWCGNAKWEYDHKYNLYQAVCLEWLNRSDEAVALYWGEIAFGFHTKHIISARLLDLYTETGSTK